MLDNHLSNGWALICSNREVYHTSRMQRVSCVRFSGDSTYVLSGSDETNIRWIKCELWRHSPHMAWQCDPCDIIPLVLRDISKLLEIMPIPQADRLKPASSLVSKGNARVKIEKFLRCKISTYNKLKTYTKYEHGVRGGPTLKEVDRFRSGSVRVP